MTATNYSVSKSTAAASLNSSTLPDDIVTKILDNLGNRVRVVEFGPSNPTGNAIKGKDLVLIDPNGPVDLSSISKANIKGVDAFIFTTNEDVDFALSGSNTLSFKGVVTTNAGDDNIILNSKVGVTVSSGDGDDNVITGRGRDSVKLGAGDDTVNTGAGNDSVSAGVGDDIINTGAGNDSVSTGSGNDSVNTGSGNDTVFVGSGNTVVNMGSGNDTARLDFGFSGAAEFNGGGGGNDRLDLRYVNIDEVSSFGTQLTITLDDGSVIQATNFEKFVYDDNPSNTEEDIVIVGAHQLDDNF